MCQPMKQNVVMPCNTACSVGEVGTTPFNLIILQQSQHGSRSEIYAKLPSRSPHAMYEWDLDPIACSQPDLNTVLPQKWAMSPKLLDTYQVFQGNLWMYFSKMTVTSTSCALAAASLKKLEPCHNKVDNAFEPQSKHLEHCRIYFGQ